MTTLSGQGNVRRATMNDVARLAGVSIKTVSRVVNDESCIHPATAQRVRTAIDQLGFRRNLSARHLRRGTDTGTLGLILEDTANPFSSVLTRAIEDVAQAHGCQVLSGSSDEDPVRERELAWEFCARRVDGLLVVPAGQEHEYLGREIESGTPVVFLDRPADDIDADTVVVDNVGGAASAARHLAAHGHRSIAFFGDRRDIHTAQQRLSGFEQGCAQAGIAFDPDLVIMGPHTTDSLARAIDSLPPRVTALITGNNRITVAAVRALAARDTRFALVGFDDFEMADLLTPPITVVAYDTWELGRRAAGLLFTRIEGGIGQSHRSVLPTWLQPRGSGETLP